MDFRLTDQEKALQDLARDFADRHIRPGLLDREWEPDSNKRFPWDIVEAGSAAGLRTLTVPPEYGGPEPRITQLARAVVCEELAVADPAVAVIFQTAMKDPGLIDIVGTKEQKDWFFPEFMRDPRYLTCTAGTEPAHGSDWILPYDEFHFDTRAELDGDEWVINGEKYTVTNGSESKIVILFACTDPSVPLTKGSSAFLVPKGPGVEATQIHPKVGLRLMNSARIAFDNCRIPKHHLFGKLNAVFPMGPTVFMVSNLLTQAIQVGIARSAFDEALEYAKMRVQGGKPIVQHQAIGLKLSEMYTLMEAMRAMVYRSAWMLDNPEELDRRYLPALNWYAAESCYRATTLGMHVCGCGGGWLSLLAQKHVRDALVYFPNEGTHTVQLLKVHQMLQA